MELVRFRIADLQQPATHWLEVYNQLSNVLETTIQRAGLPALTEDEDHPWNDRSEYVIFDGVTPEHLPAINQVAQQLQCSYQYPCHRDISAWGDGGKWYHPLG